MAYKKSTFRTFKKNNPTIAAKIAAVFKERGFKSSLIVSVFFNGNDYVGLARTSDRSHTYTLGFDLSGNVVL